jgi:calmodulin
LQEAKEINFIKDILTKYQDAPVKAFLGKEPFAEAHTYKAKAFTDAQVGTLIEHLNHEFTTLEEVIKKVFKAFDTDNSGFIDAQELADVSKELGKVMDQAELEECLKDLDQNKDGKISLEEFQAWWLSGRQGLSGTMRRLLGYKLGALKFVDSISGTLKETLEEAANQAVDVSTNNLSININKVEHAGLSVYVKGMLLSQENKTDY